jgi:hypothetical protein
MASFAHWLRSSYRNLAKSNSNRAWSIKSQCRKCSKCSVSDTHRAKRTSLPATMSISRDTCLSRHGWLAGNVGSIGSMAPGGSRCLGRGPKVRRELSDDDVRSLGVRECSGEAPLPGCRRSLAASLGQRGLLDSSHRKRLERSLARLLPRQSPGSRHCGPCILYSDAPARYSESIHERSALRRRRF